MKKLLPLTFLLLHLATFSQSTQQVLLPANFNIKTDSQQLVNQWEHHILNLLNYIRNTGDSGADFQLGKKRFLNDYPNHSSPIQLALELQKKLNYITQLREPIKISFKEYFIHKTPENSFLVFKHDGKIIASEPDANMVINQLIMESKEYENIYLHLDNFENDSRKERFLENANLSGSRSFKNISFEECVLFERTLNTEYSVPRKLLETDITEARYQGATRNHISLSFLAEFSPRMNLNLNIYSSNKKILIDLINEINKKIFINGETNHKKEKVILFNMLNNFKKNMKERYQLKNNDDPIIVVNTFFVF